MKNQLLNHKKINFSAKVKSGRLILLALAVLGLLIPFGAQAVDFTPPVFWDLSYQGQFVSQSAPDPIVLEAGATTSVTMKFKNTGAATWYNSGKKYISAYTVGPNYRESEFAASGWLKKWQPAKINESQVAPGGVGSITITLRAPAKPGDYLERFYLAAEDTTWMRGTYFYFPITVKPAAALAASPADKKAADVPAPAAGAVSSTYRAERMARSARALTAGAGGETMEFAAVFNNSGPAAWDGYELRSDVDKGNFSDSSWLAADKVLSSSQSVPAGENARLIFKLRAPPAAGSYTAVFKLKVKGEDTGGVLDIPLTVLSNAPAGYAPPSFLSSVPALSGRTLIEQPDIRVHLFAVGGPVKFRSPFPYLIFAGAQLQGELPAGEIVTLEYLNGTPGVYVFKSASFNFSALENIKLAPADPNYYFELPSYSRPVSWKGNVNFNVYRGTFDYKYSPRKDVVYAVNELPLDLYVAGIGETSNAAPPEYIKAVLTAARSYAYYNITHGVPSEERTFDVYATTADQLYLGYNHEVLAPNVVAAQALTDGEMVTYKGEPVTTPYFAHSDGRTRSWQEVWGGADKPWLKSVKAPYDVGKKMLGHGVGISMDDAAARAKSDGWDYRKILQYYYTGVEIEKIY